MLLARNMRRPEPSLPLLTVLLMLSLWLTASSALVGAPQVSGARLWKLYFRALSLSQQKGPGGAAALRLVSETQHALGDTPGALVTLSQAIKRSKVPVARDYFMKGEYERALGRSALALSDYSKAVEISPNFLPAREQRAALTPDEGLAVLDYSALIKARPEHGKYYLLRSYSYFLEGEYSACLKDARAVFDHNPTKKQRSSAYELLGRSYYALYDYGRAYVAFDHMIKVGQDLSSALVQRALTLDALGETKSALRDLQKAKRASPLSYRPYFEEAIVLFNHGHYKRALQDYQKTLTLSPDFSLAQIYLGDTYVALGKVKSGCQSYKSVGYGSPLFSSAQKKAAALQCSLFSQAGSYK